MEKSFSLKQLNSRLGEITKAHSELLLENDWFCANRRIYCKLRSWIIQATLENARTANSLSRYFAALALFVGILLLA